MAPHWPYCLKILLNFHTWYLKVELKASIEKLMCSDYKPSHEVYHFNLVWGPDSSFHFHIEDTQHFGST